ncbi:hypothetical protein ACIBL3_29630 [Kribbella sp. NPDC050124]|uniref:hypothetical protein n=1 Tax=Kribbella sp. NPDC050124 TaxID=3364114 RepID=UPI0037B7FA40
MNNSTPLRIFLTRGLIAIAWAATFAAVTKSLTTSVTILAGALLVTYPLIDAVATLVDARSQSGSARRFLLANTVSSAVAAIALGIAATRSATAVIAVFGIWASVSGAAQLVVVLRRRAQLGLQVPLLLANGLSIIGGLAYLIAAAAGQPRLNMLAIYAATGGIEFVIQAYLLTRRRRRLTTTPAPVMTTA